MTLAVLPLNQLMTMKKNGNEIQSIDDYEEEWK